MTLDIGLTNALNFLLINGGRPINLRYYTATTGSIYDEADVLTQSGTQILLGSSLTGSTLSDNGSYVLATGNSTPDATGAYQLSGTNGGSPAYVHLNGSYWLYFENNNLSSYVIDPQKGAVNPYWNKVDPNGMIGSYQGYDEGGGDILVGSPFNYQYVNNYLTNSVWTTGLMFCTDPNNAEDTLLLEQGKIGMNDIRVYTTGDLIYSPNTGSVLQTIVGVGSPSTEFYSMIPIGANTEEVCGIAIYKRAYLRRLTNGSLIGM